MQAALDRVTEKLQQMKRDQQQQNAEELAELQKGVGEMWRGARESDELKELMKKG